MGILKKNRDKMVALQLIGWGVVLSVTLFLSINSRAHTFDYVMFVVRSLPLLFIYILNYTLVIPRLLFKGKRFGFFFINAIVVVLLVVISQLARESSIMMELNPMDMVRERHHMNPTFLVYEGINYALMVGLVTAVRLVYRLEQSEEALKEAEKARVEAELANLRSQINPHFLLNTLNNIYSLTAIDIDRAQKSIKELSRLLQYVLYDNYGDRVYLFKEVEFLENYIELMRIRLNPNVRLNIEFLVEKQSTTQIAPLIFISLIENAFKHGVSAEFDSYISIRFEDKVEEGVVILSIENRNHPKNENDKSGHGIGLEQVKKRLDLQYENAYNWEITENSDIYRSTLTIKV